MKGYRRFILTGSSGSGKSYSVLDHLKLLPKLDLVLVFTTTPNQGVWNLLANICKREDTEFQLYDKIPSETFLDENEQALSENKNNLIILDDVGLKSLKNDLYPMFTKSRHVNCHVILIFQRYFAIPLLIRENANTLCIFKNTSGYDEIYKKIKILLKKNKELWDNLTFRLSEPENCYSYYLIDLEDFKDPISFVSGTKNKRIEKIKIL